MNSPNASTRNQFDIHGHKFEISQLQHPDKQGWRHHLALVSSLPTRFVGLVFNKGSEIEQGTPFYVYAALQYVCQMQLTPVKQKVKDPQTDEEVLVPVGFRGNTDIHALVPYDLMMVPHVQVMKAEHVIWVRDQDETVQQWFYNEYLRYFDPPKIEKPSGIIMPGR